MRDYEELVKKLRDCRNMAVYSKFWWDITTQAADAIEDFLFFTRRLEELRKDGWYLQRTVSDMNECCVKRMDIPKLPKEDEK